MRRFVSTVNMEKEVWLKYRKMGLTGTDAAAITGMSPYKSPFDVYMDKTTDEIELLDNERLRQGRDLEEYVASRFCEETNLKVRRVNAIYQNKEHPILLADFDRLIVGAKAGLECKTVNPYVADKWKDGKIPIEYQLQCQHYLAVSGYEKWYVAAMIFGVGFVIREIVRDDELINNLITIEERFWNDHILKGVMPNPDGSTAYSKSIADHYLGDKEIRISISGVKEKIERREELEQLIYKLIKEKEVIDQGIKLQMGEAAYADGDGYSIRWIPTTTNRLDTGRLKEEKPDIYEAYVKPTHSRRFQIKAA